MDEMIFTETLLNEALANLTISALSLNYWYDSINGMSTKQFNLYQFTHKINFFLPYGLPLLFAIPIIALGIMALYHNGVSAIDGGFLQLLVTTTGRTELESHATKACLGGYENISRELKELKVRFGELLTDEDGFEKGEEAAEREVREESSIQQQSGHEEVYDSVRQSEEHNHSTLASSVKIPTATPGVVRRAGFGTLEETRPLVRGVQYG
jgi:deoxyhypusine synthase